MFDAKPNAASTGQISTPGICTNLRAKTEGYDSVMNNGAHDPTFYLSDN